MHNEKQIEYHEKSDNFRRKIISNKKNWIFLISTESMLLVKGHRMEIQALL